MFERVEQSSAVFSACRRYRYRLFRRVALKGSCFAFFGINPSTAGHEEEDRTTMRRHRENSCKASDEAEILCAPSLDSSEKRGDLNMRARRVKLVDRVVGALSADDLTIVQLANSLFVTPYSARQATDRLLQQGVIKRVPTHNRKTGRPEYRYSLVASSTQFSRAQSVEQLVGDWDSL
jgi:hypothetical protein